MKRIFDEKMLSDDEKRFMLYWQNNREKEKKLFRQWLVGLPLGVVFGLALALNFSSGWYKRAEYVANSKFNPLVLIIAVVMIVSFMAIFSKSHKWEMNEQKYLELKLKEKRDENKGSTAEGDLLS